MTTMHEVWRKPTSRIMKAINSMEDSQTIEKTIVEALENAYCLGYGDADRNLRQPESMGR